MELIADVRIGQMDVMVLFEDTFKDEETSMFDGDL